MLTSRRSPRVIRARALHSRKARQDEQAFLVEGPTLVSEAMDAGLVIEEIFHVPNLSSRWQGIVTRARERSVDIVTVSESVLEAIAAARTPQGLIAVASRVPAPAVDAVIRADADMLVALDRIADPGNLGTIIRTAEAAGSRAVILLGPSVDPWGPKVVRASAGSVFRVPVVEISAADLLVAADSAGLRILAADVSDGRPPWDVLRERRTGLLWVFGSESHGLSADLLDAADTRVTIPMAGAVESVNLAASVAVCLFSQARERMTD